MKTTKIILLAMLVSFGLNTIAQVAINNDGSAPDGSAMLDVKSTTGGLLLPRMTETERDLIDSPVEGLFIFNTTTGTFNYYTGGNWRIIGGVDCMRPDVPDEIIGPDTVCSIDTVIFSITPVFGATSYSWYVGYRPDLISGQGTIEVAIDFNATTYDYGISVTSINDCGESFDNAAKMVIAITPPSISTQPQNQNTICGSNSTFSISCTGELLNYQWQENQGSGFVNITNGSVYSGTSTNNLQISSTPIEMDTYEYKCVISNGYCDTQETDIVTLNVNSAEITSQSNNQTIACGENALFSVSLNGTISNYQWQEDQGSGFADITDGGIYSGVTTNQLQLTFPTIDMNNYLYRCIVTGFCSTINTNNATLTVNGAIITSQPNDSSIIAYEGGNASFSVIASGYTLTYQWQENDGSGFADISETAIYSGTTTNVLQLTGATASMDGYLYRCVLSSPSPCTSDTPTNNATLYVDSFDCGTTTIQDSENNTYNTVLIGTQCWMAENLNIGTTINSTNGGANNDGDQTDNSIIEKYCYDDDDANCTTYGGLYQWNEMMQYVTTEGVQGICPSGWHVPTDDEWKILEGTVDTQYGIGDSEWDGTGFRGFDAGKRLKSTSGWNNNGNGTDIFGFNALAGGYHHVNGYFTQIGYICKLRSSTQIGYLREAYRELWDDSDQIKRGEYYMPGGYSVRCIRD